MANRTITDSAGRTWTCESDAAPAGGQGASMGRDVVLACATPSVATPVRITVGWQWENMSASGLGRLLLQTSPLPRRTH